MTEITLRQDNQPLLPQAAAGLVEWAHAAQAAHALATSLVKTSFVPTQYRGKPEEATAAILAGSEIGLSPMAALRAFDNIQGIAAPKAVTLVAVAQSHGHQIEVVEESDTRAVVRYRRKGEKDWKQSVWTIEDAQRLGLATKDNWKKQPRAMLVARASSQAARRVASDAILGIAYSAEELLDEAPQQDGVHVVTDAPRRVTAAEILNRPATPTPETPVVDVQDPPDGYDDTAWIGEQEALA